MSEKTTLTITSGKFDIVDIGRMHSGRCAMTVEGMADVDGEPKRVQVEIAFKIGNVRVHVRPAPLSAQPDRRCPCDPVNPAGVAVEA